MAILTSKLVVDLIDGATRPARGILGTMRQLRAAGDGFRQSQAAMAMPVAGLVRNLALFGAGVFGVREGFRGTVGAASSFESSFADVKKVIDATDDQFANMRRDIIALSKDIPIAADGFAQIYAAAGQSGIANEELKSFSEATAKVATAWETPVDATGEALAKIKTALARDVKGTISLADAINHVGNVSAANSPDLLEYTNRVAAFAETAGFSAEQALAFGGAMIGSGFEPEVAATSFRNMAKALTMGERATKAQRGALKLLGLDATKTAKGMQKNAVKTTLDVLDRIKKLPEYQQISIAGALFGDEARALAPLFRDSAELRRLLTETGDAAKYAGSAFEEYRKRAETTANTWERLKNNVAAIGIGIGDKMLPAINQGMAGILDVMATLGERATIFDQMAKAAQGFAQGLGYNGGIREMVNDIGDLLLGVPDGAKAADDLGYIFMRFKEYGIAVREFSDAVRDNPLAQFLGEMSGYGFKLMLTAVGVGILAGSVMKLGRAMLFLSGASTAWGILRGVGRFGGLAAGSGGGALKGGSTAAAGGGWIAELFRGSKDLVGSGAQSNMPGVASKAGSKLLGFMSLLGRASPYIMAAEVTARAFADMPPADPRMIHPERMPDAHNQYNKRVLGRQGSTPAMPMNDPVPFSFGQLWRDLTAPVGKGQNEVSILGTPPVAISGTPQVMITNPPPRPNVTIHAPITVTGITDLNSIASQLRAKVNEAMSGIQADVEYAPGM